MLLSMDETYDNPSEMKKYNEYQNFHNKLIEKILENSFQNEKKKY